MASKNTLLWVQRLVWICIYGGLLSLVVGTFLARTDEAMAWTLRVAGGAVAAVGVVLIYVRSRLKESV